MGKQFYTIEEAAEIIGISVPVAENWVRRRLLESYRREGRVVIPRGPIDEYRPIAEALKGIDPTPSTEEIVEAIRAGRRTFVWPEDA